MTVPDPDPRLVPHPEPGTGPAGEQPPLEGRAAILRAAVGVGLYAGAFGASYGALAVASGLSLAQTMVLSLVMFSGASQLAFVGVATASGSPLAAIPTALLLGARNAFYGVPLAATLRPHPAGRAVTAHFVIDETTAMALGQRTPRARRYAFWSTGLLLYVLWLLGSLAGALVGTSVDPSALGLDAAAPAAFLALLWPSLGTARARVTAAGGAALALLLVPVAPAGVPVVAAALVAVLGGLLPARSPRAGAR